MKKKLVLASLSLASLIAVPGLETAKDFVSAHSVAATVGATVLVAHKVSDAIPADKRANVEQGARWVGVAGSIYLFNKLSDTDLPATVKLGAPAVLLGASLFGAKCPIKALAARNLAKGKFSTQSSEQKSAE